MCVRKLLKNPVLRGTKLDGCGRNESVCHVYLVSRVTSLKRGLGFEGDRGGEGLQKGGGRGVPTALGCVHVL